MDKSEQEILSQIIENIPEPCYTLDSQWRFRFLNKAALILFQRTKEELLGKNIWTEFPQLLNTKIYAEYVRAVSQQTIVKFEDYCPFLDIWLETDAFPLKEGLSVHIRDVTDLMLIAEKQLKEEECFRHFMELSPMPIAIQAGSRWVYLNTAAVQLLGAKDPDELVGRSIFEFLHPTYWNSVKDRIREAKEENKVNALQEEKFIRLDGLVIDVEVTAMPIVYQSNPAVLGILNDITSRKHYEEKILEGERFLFSIFESIQDGLCIVDDHLNIVRTNSTMEKWYAHDMPLVGKKCYQVYKGTIIRCEGCPLNSKLTREYSTHRVIAKRGPGEKSQGWLEVHNFPLVDSATNQVKGVIKYCRDITEKKRIEQEMARFQSLNLVGEMAASIGHEVRNPMTTVRGYLQLFKSKVEFEKYSEQFDLLIDELDRANSIITEFLSLAKNRNIAFNFQNLNSIIETLTPLLKADAMVTEKNLKLNLTNVPSLLLNEKEIRQLIINLVRNGLEAMEPGGTLEIQTFCNKREVVLLIKDQGKGIDLNMLEMLGTPFLTTKDSGTGLGLAVCYSIASKHNAQIKVETSPKGTTFLVYFSLNLKPVFPEGSPIK